MRQEMRMVGVDCPWCEERFVTSVYQFTEESHCTHCEKKILLVARLESMEALRLTPLKEYSSESV